MNIEEYADILNLDLRILRYPNQDNRYCAAFERCETKDDAGSGMLTSTSGNGNSPAEAINDYIERIRGKLLVVNAYGNKERREYVVPKEITGA